MELTSLSDLLDVQDLDLQIDRLLNQRQNLPELADYKSTHDDLTAVEAELVIAGATLKAHELDFDKSEGELEMLEAKLNEHETRLFAGGMSGRETEHMRLEVQSLKGQKDAMEEKVLRLLDTVDPAREVVQQLDDRKTMLSARKEALEVVIKAEWKKIDAELARKEDRKKDAVGPVPGDLLEMYEQLRMSKEGVAVGRLENGVCGGCNMALSSAEQAEALSADPPRCVHCRRLLVG